ncbi:MAG: ABC transporter permease [Candidatus Dormibacteraeota bacterium]|nr:ABC transporter permease [Candidatus Dormibacteraeota bacterium]
MVSTDFKLRYQGSVLGYLWSLLRPLALFGILYFVFVRLLKFGSVPHYPVYLLLGIVMWNYFTEVTAGALGSIVGRGDLMRKLNFPRYVVVFSTAFSALINLAFNLIVVVIFIVVTGVPVRPVLALAPLLFIEMFILSVGIGFFLSALFVRFRDLNYIWEVVLQAGFYLTPILVPINLFSNVVQRILLLNPMAQIIQDTRWLAVTDQAQTISHAYNTAAIQLAPIGLTLAFAITAALYFRRRAPFFAEDV